MSSQHRILLAAAIFGHAQTRLASYVAKKCILDNICFRSQPQSKSSPLNELCSALPSLPMRLREVGQFVAANDYDATTRSMRDLAAAAGADPASFTRLAKALGYSGRGGPPARVNAAR